MHDDAPRVDIRIPGYSKSLSDGDISVVLPETIEPEHLPELKTEIAPVVEELRRKIRGSNVTPVALCVLDGRRKINVLPPQHQLARYARVATYPFIPAGMDLRPTWPGDGPG